MTEIINSPSNPLIKLARGLHQKKVRDEFGLFLVEGILHVSEAAEAGWDFNALFYCPGRLKSEYGRQFVETQINKGVRCIQVSENAFESFAEKENPQGLAALIRQKPRFIEDISSLKFGVAIVTPQDPGNVGTILRNIDAVGADALLLLDGGVEPYNPSSVRASMGAIFWKPFYMASFVEFSEWAKKGGIRIIGTSAHAALDYKKIKLDDRPTILLLGSEQKGLLPEQLGVCDDLVSIKMRGRASSLNLAVAAGILLYALNS
ncbi:MAG: RNA methyltransferase [Chloroflexi bacterium]|nr:RNA methyltransferase [Chloroflexota bacterium]